MDPDCYPKLTAKVISLIQLAGVAVVVLYSGGMSYLLIKIVDALVGVRVSDKEELMGLDLTQHEENAYTLID